MSTWQHSTRQHARARVDLYVNKITGDSPYLVRVRDMSVGGMYLYKLLEPANASLKEFNVEMQLPGQDELIWATVEVVREDHLTDDTVGFGVRFSRLADTDRKLIEHYVNSQPVELTSSGQRAN